PSGFERGLDLLRHHRYEPHLVQIFDRREAEPVGMLGDLELFDIETEQGRKVTVTEKNLRQYQKLFQEFQESVQHYCNRYGLGCTGTSREILLDELILKMMGMAGAVRWGEGGVLPPCFDSNRGLTPPARH